MKFGDKILGEKKAFNVERQAMNWHWAHTEQTPHRMYKCRCMLGFRVGASNTHYPKGKNAATRSYKWKFSHMGGNSNSLRVYWRKNR